MQSSDIIFASSRPKPNYWFAGIIGLVIMLMVLDSSAITVVVNAISEAYLAVSTFVAGTLLLFFAVERYFNIDLSDKLRHAGKWQVVIAAFLGALPGCGGAIIVMTRYVSGSLSFGSVLATLTATMGDAAFLLIAKEPLTGLMIIILGFSVGTITGYFVDFTHGRDFMRDALPTQKTEAVLLENDEHADLSSRFLDKLWLILMFPGLIIGIMQAFQIDIDSLLPVQFALSPIILLGFVGGILCFSMYMLPRLFPSLPRNRTSDVTGAYATIRHTISDTNFVTSWVIFAFIAFELTVHTTDFDLAAMFDGIAIYAPLLAILVGLLPGCGPQIIVTSLYLSGYIPLSALMGNAISNDGDALFPAIAIAPRTAIVATLYSTIPAVLIAYGWYFLER